MSRSLEKDLRELERLLKADQASNGGAGGGGGGTSTIKQQLRSVLRKLMEAYFNPLNVHKREMRSLLGLLKVALQRHAEVFTGSSTFCVRTFAHLLPLLTSPGLSENVTDTIVWTLCQLMGQLSNAKDPRVFGALFAGAAELAEARGVPIQNTARV